MSAAKFNRLRNLADKLSELEHDLQFTSMDGKELAKVNPIDLSIDFQRGKLEPEEQERFLEWLAELLNP